MKGAVSTKAVLESMTLAQLFALRASWLSACRTCTSEYGFADSVWSGMMTPVLLNEVIAQKIAAEQKAAETAAAQAQKQADNDQESAEKALVKKLGAQLDTFASFVTNFNKGSQ